MVEYSKDRTEGIFKLLYEALIIPFHPIINNEKMCGFFEEKKMYKGSAETRDWKLRLKNKRSQKRVVSHLFPNTYKIRIKI